MTTKYKITMEIVFDARDNEKAKEILVIMREKSGDLELSNKHVKSYLEKSRLSWVPLGEIP